MTSSKQGAFRALSLHGISQVAEPCEGFSCCSLTSTTSPFQEHSNRRISVHTLSSLILPFTVGAVSGSGAVCLFFRSRVRFYRCFIEQRLADVNERIISAHASGRKQVKVA